ncbi:hypothetical protein ACC839_38215, partial [Rhizobium ruizarguesonis]
DLTIGLHDLHAERCHCDAGIIRGKNFLRVVGGEILEECLKAFENAVFVPFQKRRSRVFGSGSTLGSRTQGSSGNPPKKGFVSLGAGTLSPA